MKQSIEEGYSLVWHSLQPWLEAYCPQPKSARAMLGRFMRDYGRDAVILAFDRTLEAHPRPADPFTYFIKLVTSNLKQLGDAQTAWNDVIRLSSNCSIAASRASPRINDVVGQCGGWLKIGSANEKAMGQLRQMFVALYNETPA